MTVKVGDPVTLVLDDAQNSVLTAHVVGGKVPGDWQIAEGEAAHRVNEDGFWAVSLSPSYSRRIFRHHTNEGHTWLRGHHHVETSAELRAMLAAKALLRE